LERQWFYRQMVWILRAADDRRRWADKLAMEMTMLKLQRAAPTFAVADVGTTMRWYEEHLGFRGHPFPEKEPFAFASLLRDGVELMLLHIDGHERPDIASRRPEGYWDSYIRIQAT
jgi:hypothetical protein